MEINLSAANVEDPNNTYIGELRLQNEIYLSEVGFTEVLDHEVMYSDWPPAGKDVCFSCLMSTTEMDGEEYTSEGIILEREKGMAGVYHRIGWMRVFHPLPFNTMFGQERLKGLDQHNFLEHKERHTYRYKIV